MIDWRMFEGLFAAKLGSGQEGEGLFFRSSKFSHAANRTLSLRAFFSSLSSEVNSRQSLGGGKSLQGRSGLCFSSLSSEVRSHDKKLIIYEISSRQFTTQNDLCW